MTPRHYRDICDLLLLIATLLAALVGLTLGAVLR